MRLEDQTPTASEAAREKLLDAAGPVFARSGFRHSTVREICKSAGVNVAAVNYHFGSKQELYAEVLKRSLLISKGAFDNDDLVHQIGEIADPEEALRATLRIVIRRSLGAELRGPHERMMVHELAEPSPVLSSVVQEAIAPRYRMLCGIVGKMLKRPPEDPKVRYCVHSIIGQALHFVHGRPVIEVLWPDFRYTPEQIDQTAEHIADFCLKAITGLVSEDHKGKQAKKDGNRDERNENHRA